MTEELSAFQKADQDHEKQAAICIAEILCTCMQKAYDETHRRFFFYVWEREGFLWLLDYVERRSPEGLNAWTGDFMLLNEDAIRAPHGRINFNMRGNADVIEAARQKKYGDPA